MSEPCPIATRIEKTDPANAPLSRRHAMDKFGGEKGVQIGRIPKHAALKKEICSSAKIGQEVYMLTHMASEELRETLMNPGKSPTELLKMNGRNGERWRCKICIST